MSRYSLNLFAILFFGCTSFSSIIAGNLLTTENCTAALVSDNYDVYYAEEKLYLFELYDEASLYRRTTTDSKANYLGSYGEAGHDYSRHKRSREHMVAVRNRFRSNTNVQQIAWNRLEDNATEAYINCINAKAAANGHEGLLMEAVDVTDTNFVMYIRSMRKGIKSATYKFQIDNGSVTIDNNDVTNFEISLTGYDEYTITVARGLDVSKPTIITSDFGEHLSVQPPNQPVNLKFEEHSFAIEFQRDAGLTERFENETECVDVNTTAKLMHLDYININSIKPESSGIRTGPRNSAGKLYQISGGGRSHILEKTVTNLGFCISISAHTNHLQTLTVSGRGVKLVSTKNSK